MHTLISIAKRPGGRSYTTPASRGQNGARGTRPAGQVEATPPEPWHGEAPGELQHGATGFTLVELTGVLVIIAVLAGVILSSVLASMKLSARDAEGQTLATIAGALQTTILRNKYIPGTNDWSAVVGGELGLSSSAVATTRYGNPRMLLIDPACRIGTNATSTLPFTQTRNGSLQPVSPRLILMSSLGDPLPAAPTNGFAQAWATAAGSVPAYFPASWEGKEADFKIQRMDLAGLFTHLILENEDIYQAAPYSIESLDTLTNLSAGGRLELWFLDNTVINLHFGTNSLQGTSFVNVLQAREYLVDDASYTFENGRWGRYLRSGRNDLVGTFGKMADKFLNAATPAAPKNKANKQAIVDQFFNYLFYFALWGSASFPQATPMTQIPEFCMSTNAQVEMVISAYNISH